MLTNGVLWVLSACDASYPRANTDLHHKALLTLANIAPESQWDIGSPSKTI